MAKSTVNPNRVKFTRLERAHLNLIQALTVQFPHRIVGQADACDVEARAEYLHGVFGIVSTYLEEVIADTKRHLPVVDDADWGKIDIAIGDSINEGDSTVIADLARAGVRFDLQAEAA